MRNLWMTPHAAVLVDPSPGWATTLAGSMSSGGHALVVTSEVASIEGRLAGFELRDTLLILSSGPRPRYAFLFRKPTDGAILDQVIESSAGALNIADCRIGWGQDTPSQDEWNNKGSTGSGSANIGQNTAGMREAYAKGAVPVPSGRWPPNVLLVHAPECRHECTPDCPVRLLDQQTGERPSTLTGRADPTQIHENPGDNHGTSTFGGGNSKVYADSGGASRYYPQFTNEDEMIGWMQRLLEGPKSP